MRSQLALIALLFFGCSAQPPAPQSLPVPTPSVPRASGWTVLVFDSVGTSVEVPEIRTGRVDSNFGEFTDVDQTSFSFLAEPNSTGFLEEERYRPYYVFVERDGFAEHNRIIAGEKGFFIATIRVPFFREEARRDDILRSFRSIRRMP